VDLPSASDLDRGDGDRSDIDTKNTIFRCILGHGDFLVGGYHLWILLRNREIAIV